MNKVYDNGEMILGSIYNIKDYICKNCEDPEEIKEIIEDLENLDATDIVCIDYDCGMGYTIDYWKSKDIVKE